MSNNEQSIEVNVTPTTEGDINIDVDLVADGVHESISREILKTKEEQTHKALVALGWTPPVGDAPIVADTAMLVDAIVGRGVVSIRQGKAAEKYGYAKYVNVGCGDPSWQWDREALSMLSLRKLLGIYTNGKLNVEID